MLSQYRLYKGAWIGIDESKETRLTKSECYELLQRGGLFVRNVYDFDCQEETSFWYVIKDSFGGIEELSATARRYVRRSLRIYNVRKISFDEILRVGHNIFAKAQESYKVKCEVISVEDFQQMILAYDKDVTEFWGVESKETGEIVALSINTVKENSCEYNTLKCLPNVLKDGSQPYYGLIFEMNRYYLDEVGLKYVNDGARSITNHSNIQPFLMQNFKFRKAYCKMYLYYKWYMRLAVKLLYPFRKLIKHPKVAAVLNMEAMSRGDM